MYLAADVGGTKTNLAVYAQREGVPARLVERTLPSAPFESLDALVRAFLTEVDLHVDAAAFGVPGPVVGGRARTTNLPWCIDADALAGTLSIRRVALLNDLEATAYGTQFLSASDLHTLHTGERDVTGPVAVLAPGTGLGEAFLFHDGARYRAHASEGGHADFAPADPLQVDLLRYLQREYKHVSVERVCSGRGLPNLYDFLKKEGYALPTLEIEEALRHAQDPTPVILSAALNGMCTLCERTLVLFLDILAAEAGNLALKVLATGGVYLGGGILPRVVSEVDRERFVRMFTNKGRLSDVLRTVPVQIILEPRAALFGAACYAATELLEVTA